MDLPTKGIIERVADLEHDLKQVIGVLDGILDQNNHIRVNCLENGMTSLFERVKALEDVDVIDWDEDGNPIDSSVMMTEKEWLKL